MGRAIGLDLGTKRIGVAVSDTDGTVATPIEVVERSGDRAGDHRRIAAIVAEWEAETVVVGLPLSLDGTSGSAAAAAVKEADLLARALPVPVTTYDERLTTVEAHRMLAARDVPERARRGVVDMVAASLILQSWLDRMREGREHS
jgi:putative holliday junction resolvase